jgi:hypothetical protein
VKALLSDEHFSVNGTLIEAWASMKSFRPKDGTGRDDNDDNSVPNTGQSAEIKPKGRNAESDFRGEKRSNATHASSTDPDVRLFKNARGQAAKLCHMGHVLMQNRNGLVVDAMLTHATGTAEREAALAMLARMAGRHCITLGADKAYDTAGFIAALRGIVVTPHVAQNWPPLCHRWSHHSPCRLQGLHPYPEEDRGNLWVGKDVWRSSQDPPSRWGSRRLELHADGGCL